MPKVSFTGNGKYALDTKGRITIPTEYRQMLGECFTIGMNECFSAVALYPKESWEAIVEELERIPRSDREAMKQVRMIYGNSFTNNYLDAQGRVLIPQTMREYLNMVKDVRFVGTGACLEVWDEASFVKWEQKTQAELDAVQNYVFEKYFSA